MIKYLHLSLSVFLTLVVLSFSVASGSESASLSMTVATKIAGFFEGIIPDMTIDIDTFHLVIRKTAHIVEYLVLGLSWHLTFTRFGWSGCYLWILGLCLAAFDESIQMLAENRGPSIMDVLLFDFPGFLLGSIFIPYIYNKAVQKRSN